MFSPSSSGVNSWVPADTVKGSSIFGWGVKQTVPDADMGPGSR